MTEFFPPVSVTQVTYSNYSVDANIDRDYSLETSIIINILRRFIHVIIRKYKIIIINGVRR